MRSAPNLGLVALFLLACVWAPMTATAVSPTPRVKIGFIVKMPEESWFQMEWQFAQNAGKDLGFDVIPIGAPDGQAVLAGIDALAAQGAKGFVICAPDVKLGPAILARARALKLKVIAVDDQLVGSDGFPLKDVPYLGIGAAAIGRSVGSVLQEEKTRRGWVDAETGAMAITYKELETARERVDGTTTSLVTLGFPRSAIFETAQKTTDVEGGFNAASALIVKNPKVKRWLVYGLNDETVLGAVQALESRGFKAADVIGVGINGMATAVNEFRKPGLTGFFASVLLDAKRHGYDTAAMMYYWITADRVPPPDSRTTGTVITRDNWAAVFKANGLGGLIR